MSSDRIRGFRQHIGARRINGRHMQHLSQLVVYHDHAAVMQMHAMVQQQHEAQIAALMQEALRRTLVQVAPPSVVHVEPLAPVKPVEPDHAQEAVRAAETAAIIRQQILETHVRRGVTNGQVFSAFLMLLGLVLFAFKGVGLGAVFALVFLGVLVQSRRASRRQAALEAAPEQWNALREVEEKIDAHLAQALAERDEDDGSKVTSQLD